MQVHIESWFGTPIYYTKFTDDVLPMVQQEIADVVEQTQNLLEPNKSASHLLSSPTFDINLFDNYKLDFFKQQLCHHILMYAGKSSGHNWSTDDFRITASWITMNKKHSYAIPHSHGTCDIAGCYYFKTNQKDGEIYFQNPNKLLVNSRLFSSHSVVRYTPEVGKLLLFPGWLDHGVIKNTTSNTRISFSFNVRFNEISAYS